MNNGTLNSMVKFINNRIQKYLRSVNVVTQYAGTIVGTDKDNKYFVRIAGSDTIFSFPNKTNQELNEQDSVYIQTMNNDLNTGVIMVAFKSYSKSDILLAVYPVGSIYLSLTETSPSLLFGGTWEQIKDTFLLSAGDTYAAGTTGGRSGVNLSANIGACNNDESTLGYVAGGKTPYQNAHNPNYVVKGASSSRGGSWNHSTPVTEDGSSNRSVNIMPPYLTVYMWKRTA